MPHIQGKPTSRVEVRTAVLVVTDGRGDVNDSLDQLGLLLFWHGVVAALEFVGVEVVARLQERDGNAFVTRSLRVRLRLHHRYPFAKRIPWQSARDDDPPKKF
jgi:hypothetical protein